MIGSIPLVSGELRSRIRLRYAGYGWYLKLIGVIGGLGRNSRRKGHFPYGFLCHDAAA
jgi:hypothetical protein